MRILKTQRQDLTRVRFTPDGRGLLAVGRREAVLWPDCAAGDAAVRYAPGGLWSADLDSSGRFVVTNSAEGVAVHDAVGRLVCRVTVAHQRADLVTASPTEPLFLLHLRFHPLTAWRFRPTGEAVRAWAVPWQHRWSEPAFRQDGAEFVQSEFRGWEGPGQPFWLVFRRAETGQVAREVLFPRFPGQIAVSADGTLLAYEVGGSGYVHEAAGDCRQVGQFTGPAVKTFTAVAFHPTTRAVAATSNDGSVRLYDPTAWALVRTFAWDVGRLRCVAFSRDGTLAAVGSDTGRVVLWDVDL